MTFKQILLAACALVISATAATAQIPSYVPTNGLLGWWPFNGNANDESGNGNDGVVNGATLTADRFSNENNAFETSSGYISALGGFITTTGTISISTWFNCNSDFGVGEIICLGSSSSTSWGCVGGNHLFALNYGRGCGSTGSSAVDISFEYGTWHNVVYVSSGLNSTTSIYFDGVMVGTSLNANSNNNCSNSVLFFGADVFSGIEYYDGKLDDIAIYNRALTPQEIQNLYAGSNETVDTGNGAAPLPQGIPYQAAARDAQGQSLVNAAVNVRFTLHEGAADGAASYAETHSLTTNSVGLFNTVFGNGTPEQSAFDSINWAATTKFLQVEIDLGEGYVDMGTTQLLSVPYALRSDEAARLKNAGLPIFNDNAAALAGGLVAGEMYRTAAGVLMIAY
jgi:hypothetical protein